MLLHTSIKALYSKWERLYGFFESDLPHYLNSAIFDDPNNAPKQPVFQCVQIKPLAGQQGVAERFRVVFSDIRNFVQSMLATRK